MKVTFQMRIIVRPSFPNRHDILLTGDVTDFPNIHLVQVAFDIERILNEYMPQIRVHVAINIEE